MEKIIILDFGSQYTQLIARRLRELNVYSEIHPYNDKIDLTDPHIKAFVLSGSPFSVNGPENLDVDIANILEHHPVLAICYGAQLAAKQFGGRVEKSNKREYGKAHVDLFLEDKLLDGVIQHSQVWMSHADTILELPDAFEVLAGTNSIPIAIFRSKEGYFNNEFYGLQFHPEVTHSLEGKHIMDNFVTRIASFSRDWTPASFIESTVAELKLKLGNDKVILGLSGGVDSTVAAMLLHRAIGKNLYGIFVNNGLLRKYEFEQVLDTYKVLGLNVRGVDASEEFLTALEGVSDPEKKRKVIGRVFIEVFERVAHEMTGVDWLAQGTIYPDVIESISVKGPSATIKSHHNVGGLPEKLKLKIVEPLKTLFKDEVRTVGFNLGLTDSFVHRHPFPGPGMGIRILGEITREKLKLNQEADHIFISKLKSSGWYDKVWQAGTILLPVKSVGVMGDERTYEYTVALRAVNSRDGMTANWTQLPYELLGEISNEIINQVRGINRVVYDISTKPPATIEWE
ncbi:MAG: glutamine-hydrolyzing GMP synthase [Saprospiraceae bacterium]|nr:glutamine-hydrolyzing GMP synthase [Bacteroidia bacterium]MBT8229682.1 glutamine-hydrolyzing GMP synthase [Bacteroidia bacterium]NNF21642.1 glutamine-hydrolyzing GMP synthase [Saprospiraceae bacterium]NNK90494.1 glutamine-hydrolyzing GMP synthase [Saprospiraceae bacterium]